MFIKEIEENNKTDYNTYMEKKDIKSFDSKLAEYKKEEEERLVVMLSKKYGIPPIHKSEVQLSPDALQLIKEDESREAGAAIFKRSRNTVHIAVKDVNNPALQELLSRLERRGFEHTLYLASTATVEHFWEYYKDIISTSATSPGELSITNENLEEMLQNIHSIDDAKNLLGELKTLSRARKISKNVEYIISAAVALDVSDIHIEPTQEGGAVRYRIDGVLVDMALFSESEYKQLLTRLKLVSGMKITQKGAQDGGFVIELRERSLSARASIIPEEEGGSFVIRLLDPKNVIHDIGKLGLHPTIQKAFYEEIQKPNGMIITTGPTGSGKTTTLYSFLNAVRDPKVKIITLEDPIEYRMDGIVQTQVEKDYTFGSGLRAIVRQDPDIILVGEIRDEEVAEIAINASLTGHLVFSTLHTNDAIGALPRLIQFGIDEKLFANAINIVIAQRLVRVLCPECSEKHPLTDEEKEKLQKHIDAFPEAYKTDDINIENIRRPIKDKQCEGCNGGYKGRIGVFEVFKVNNEVEKALIEEKSFTELREIVNKQGFPFLEQDGLWKVLQGKTSLEELERVLGFRL